MNQIQALAPQMPTKYLRNFFAEKDIPEMEWEIFDVDGTPHRVSNVAVIGNLTQANPKEAKKLDQVFKQLDRRDADVNNFLKHLSGAVINMGVAASEIVENPAQDPVITTAAGAGLGSLAGVILGSFLGGPGLGSVVGGAVGGYYGAPDDRKNRGAWGGGLGGLFTPIGAVAGGAIGGRKPSKRKNNPNTADLVNKLKF